MARAPGLERGLVWIRRLPPRAYVRGMADGLTDPELKRKVFSPWNRSRKCSPKQKRLPQATTPFRDMEVT